MISYQSSSAVSEIHSSNIDFYTDINILIKILVMLQYSIIEKDAVLNLILALMWHHNVL